MNKSIRLHFLVILLSVQTLTVLYGQVSIGSNIPEPSAVLNVVSNNAGFLIPRMTETNRKSISTPANGLLVYQTNGKKGFYIYNSSDFPPEWKEWSIEGTTETFVVALNSLDSLGVESGHVRRAHLTDGAVSNITIENKSINSFKIADNALLGTHFIDGSINYSKISTAGLSDGVLYSWDNALSKWVTRSAVDGIQFLGHYNPSTNTPVLRDDDHLRSVKSGTYYIAGSSAVRDFGSGNVSVGAGNWVIYQNKKWTSLVVNSISSVFGRVGNISAQKDDYKWDQIENSASKLSDISDVEIDPITIRTNYILRWNSTKKRWVQGVEYGDNRRPIASDGIKTGAVIGDHLKRSAITEPKIKSKTIDGKYIFDKSVNGENIDKSSVLPTLISTTGVADSAVLIYDTGSWSTKNVGFGLKYLGVWNAASNSPKLKDNDPAAGLGSFYIVSTAGAQDLGGGTTISYSVGDRVLYERKTPNSRWTRISPSGVVQSFNSRKGARITADAGDYTWAMIDKSASDITSISDIYVPGGASSFKDEYTLTWDFANSRFISKADVGHRDNPVDKKGIVADAISSVAIKSLSLKEANIKSGAVREDHFTDLSVDSVHILINSLGTNTLKDGAIENRHLSSGIKIDNSYFPDDSLDSTLIEDNSLLSKEIANTTITEGLLQSLFVDGGVKNVALADLSVGSDAIRNGSISNSAAFNDKSVTSSKIMVNSLIGPNFSTSAGIDSTKVKDGTIATVDIAQPAVVTANIKNRAIGSGQIASDNIEGKHIKAGTVTANDLVNATLETKHFNTVSITTQKIGNTQIVTDHIKDASLTSDHLATSLVLHPFSNNLNRFAVLELSPAAGSSKGFLIPRMTSDQMITLAEKIDASAFVSAHYGMMVYNTDLKSVYVWIPSQWVSLNPNESLVSDSQFEKAFFGDVLLLEGKEYKVVYSNGNLWLDRNLGASQVAVKNDDPLAIGWSYQWGRKTDGHQFGSTVGVVQIPPTTATTSFISGHTNWMKPLKSDLWQSHSSYLNNPCPKGWKVPSSTDWLGLNITRNTQAFTHPLKLPFGKTRVNKISPIPADVEQYTIYWTSTTSSTPGKAKGFHMRKSARDISTIPADANYDMALGAYVRCIKIK